MFSYHFPFPCCVCSPRDGSLVYRLPVIHQLLPVLFGVAALVAACLCLLFTLSILAVYFNSPFPVLYPLLLFYVVYSFYWVPVSATSGPSRQYLPCFTSSYAPPPPPTSPGLFVYTLVRTCMHFSSSKLQLVFFSYLFSHRLSHGSLKGCPMP